MFARLKERNGLVKSALETLRKCWSQSVQTFETSPDELVCCFGLLFVDNGLEGGTAEQLTAGLAKACPALKQCVVSCKHMAETARQQSTFQSVGPAVVHLRNSSSNVH